MARHKLREKAMIATYQYLLVNRDVDELIADVFDTENKGPADPYFTDVIKTAVANETRYAGYMDQVMDGWTYERLGTVEKAILLNGCAEFDLKQIQAAIIIDEAVELAKTFCDEDSYKLINSVLDVI